MRPLSFLFLFPVILALALNSCASWRSQPVSGHADEASFREIEEEILEADLGLPEEGPIDGSRKRPRIPVEINEKVREWIVYFSRKDKERFRRFLIRGNRYKEVVQETLRRNGVPTELYYLAMIESGYQLHARSHASAVGPWQFIRATGLRYGLDQSSYLDERRDIIRSTEAGARYLRGLHNVFNSWYLALAGYNAGEGRIIGAIMKGKSRDFWELVEKKALPPETRNYVPKFLAASIIGRHPEKFGFRDLESEKFPAVSPVEIPGGVGLDQVARAASIPYQELKVLNPHLIRGVTPPDLKSYPVWIPRSKASRVAAARGDFRQVRSLASRAPAGKSTIHLVRRGENLGMIARRYRISLAQLKKWNGIRGNGIRAGARLKVGAAPRIATARKVVHRVRKGDALTQISRRYGVPVKKIRRLNDLRSSKIYVGQTLIIRNSI